MRWDIFCRVIDNFGDIGVCWRLASQLRQEYGLNIRLWVDDLVSFQRICSEVQPALSHQSLSVGVEVLHWTKDVDGLVAEVGSAEVVIEAFACELPSSYLNAMVQAKVAPIWLNLDYLSAEDWVEQCHGLPSPHPQLPLQKYFFFPGFTDKTGGLLQRAEQSRLQQHWLAHGGRQQLLHHFGVPTAAQSHQLICLFAYSHPDLAALLRLWGQQTEPVTCLVPAGALVEQLRQLWPELIHTDVLQLGRLRLQLLPYLPQQQFDQLLWCADVNFIRGEDSLVQAIWAGKPFVWQLYRQDEDQQLTKLAAFWQRFTADMPSELEQRLWPLWLHWNNQQGVVADWQAVLPLLPDWQQHCTQWHSRLNLQGDLAKNLVRFVENKFILTPNFPGKKKLLL